MAKKRTYNTQEELEIFDNFPKENIVEYINKQIRQANRQMTRLETSNVYSGAYERALADIKNGDRFGYVEDTMSDAQIKNTYARVLDFMRSPSSTVSGAREQEKIARDFFKDEHDLKFKNKQQFDDFYKALHSAEYGRAQLQGRIDSGTLNDEIHEAIKKGASANDIKNAMQQFATNELTVDEFQTLVQEQRGVKWNE